MAVPRDRSLGSEVDARVQRMRDILSEIDARIQRMHDILIEERGELPEWMIAFLNSPEFRVIQAEQIRRTRNAAPTTPDESGQVTSGGGVGSAENTREVE